MSAWADQSGVGNDYTQATGANQPTETAGHAVRCADGDDYMAADDASTTLLDADGWTAYYLMTLDDDAPNADTTYQAAAIHAVPDATWNVSCYLSAGQNYAFVHQYTAAGSKATTGIAIAKTTLYLFRARYDGSNLHCRINGSEQSVASGNITGLGPVPYLFQGFGAANLLATLRYAAVYNSHLDLTTRDGIDDWFVAQYPTVTL